MESIREALLQKLQEIQELLSIGDKNESMESGEFISEEEEVQEEGEKERQEEDRAPIVKDRGSVAEKNIELPTGRKPMSFNEKAKAFNKR